MGKGEISAIIKAGLQVFLAAGSGCRACGEPRQSSGLV